MIRAATIDDVPRILELGEVMHAESVQRSIPFSRARVAANMGALIDGGGVVFLSEKAGQVVGGIAGYADYEWFSDRMIGYEYALFVLPEHRHGLTAIKLVKAMMAWCKSKGAVEFRPGVTTGANTEGTVRLYESMGAKMLGPLLAMEV